MCVSLLSTEVKRKKSKKTFKKFELQKSTSVNHVKKKKKIKIVAMGGNMVGNGPTFGF